MNFTHTPAALKKYLPYAILALAVLAPLFKPGYILTLDAVFTPHLHMPEGISSDYLWRALLHVLSLVLPSQFIEKALFAGIIVTSGITMHRLVAFVHERLGKDKTLAWQAAPYIAGVFFAVNPYVYDRFMAGQYGLLMGYALLPLVTHLLLRFADTPERSTLLPLTLVTVGISIVSLPTLGEVVVMALAVLGLSMVRQHRQPKIMAAYLGWGAAGAAVFVLLSSYWLLPLAVGKGSIADQIAQFGPAHSAAFATGGGSFAGQLASALRLQGFWAEAHHLFVLPQGRVPGWGTIRLLVWALALTGFVVLWRRSRRLAAMFGAIGGVGLLLASGLFAGPLAHIGYREPQKLAGLLALAYALFIALSTARLLGWARRRSETWQTVLPGAVLLAVLLFTPTMYWGFGGQLHAVNYPADWTAADNYLNAQTAGGRAVFVPWHQYMSFGFAGRIIASPAAQFFGRPVVVGNNPELGAIAPPPNDERTIIGRLLVPPAATSVLANQLAGHDVRYILLAKEDDYRRYAYLAQVPGIVLVHDSPTIAVYQNLAWKGGK
jgi:hypothetical protein